jgi:hypothetical protein
MDYEYELHTKCTVFGGNIECWCWLTKYAW